MQINDLIQLSILLILALTFWAIYRQLQLQSNLSKAHLMKDRFEMPPLRNSRSKGQKIMHKLICLLFVVGSPCVFAVGGIKNISISDNVVAQGRLINLEVTSSCFTTEVVSAQDIGNGHLEIELELERRPIAMCLTFTLSFDLREYFELSAGDYSLTVTERLGDDRQDLTEISFEVQAGFFEIVPAMSGSWFDPANPGHGASIEFMNGSKHALVYWFTFDQDKNNLWLIGFGEYDGPGATLELYQARGGTFPPLFDPDDVTLEVWGTLQLDFNDCLHGSMSWTPIDAAYFSGIMPLRRISPLNGLPCFDEDKSQHLLISENLFEVNDDLDFKVHLTGQKKHVEAGIGWTVTPSLLPFESEGAEGLEVGFNPRFPNQFLNLTVSIVGRIKSKLFSSRQKSTAIQVEVVYAVNSQWLCSDQKLAVTLSLGTFEPQVMFYEGVPQYLLSNAGAVTGLTLGQIRSPRSLIECSTEGSSNEWFVRSFLTSGLDVISHVPRYLTLTIINRKHNAVFQPFYLLSLRINERNMINE